MIFRFTGARKPATRIPLISDLTVDLTPFSKLSTTEGLRCAADRTDHSTVDGTGMKARSSSLMMLQTWIVWQLLLFDRHPFSTTLAEHNILGNKDVDEEFWGVVDIDEDGTILSAFVGEQPPPPGDVETSFDASVAQQQLLLVNSANQKNRLSEKDVADIVTLMGQAAADPATRALIHRLKYGSGKADLADLRLEQSNEQIVDGLRQTMAQLILLEVLFDRDPAVALAELEKDGLVPKEHLPTYRARPELLEQDMRKAYYFSFVSLAVAGEYL
jgi:hypothetical protein